MSVAYKDFGAPELEGQLCICVHTCVCVCVCERERERTCLVAHAYTSHSVRFMQNGEVMQKEEGSLLMRVQLSALHHTIPRKDFEYPESPKDSPIFQDVGNLDL